MIFGQIREDLCGSASKFLEPDSLPHLHRFPDEDAAVLRTALEPLLEHPPKPVFTLRWDEEARAWCSTFAPLPELPGEIREVLERSGFPEPVG